MPYVTSVERLAEQRGMQQGIEQGIEHGIEHGIEKGIVEGIEAILKLRFPDAAESLMQAIRRVPDIALLRTVLHQATTVERPEQLRQLWANGANGPAA